MSAIVYTPTPFIDKQLLCKALATLKVEFVEGQFRGHQALITNRQDYYGRQTFVQRDGCFALTHDSSAQLGSYPWRKENWGTYKTISEFLLAVESAYNTCYQNHLLALEQLAAAQAEAERLRIENERIAYIAAKKEAIIAKAKEQGYAVKEKKVGENIQLILVKHTY
jgi:hypothetical protein